MKATRIRRRKPRHLKTLKSLGGAQFGKKHHGAVGRAEALRRRGVRRAQSLRSLQRVRYGEDAR